MDYKDTLNLPKTDFPMKANLSEQEPRRALRWGKEGLYQKILKSRQGRKSYVLHDGPPYANGNIHIGTALNKILKDIVVKTKIGFGFNSPYVPGWDCHGLPIELKVDRELGAEKAAVSKSEFRKRCREYAARWIDIQRESFKRLGITGDWENPYITMDYAYEAVTLKEFYRVYNTGGVYKGSKPVYWCPSCVTALAEAEVEYHDHTSHSVFVKFKLNDPSKIGVSEDSLLRAFTRGRPECEQKALFEDSLLRAFTRGHPECEQKALFKDVSAVIWTTTPWTLPANMGISANPNERYSVMRVDKAEGKNLAQGELLLIAKPLTADDAPLKKNMNILAWSEIKEVEAGKLDRLTARHPFYEKDSLFMLGDHVLMSDGTGLVHTAPAHGLEDYEIGLRYALEPFNPVDDHGRFKSDLPIFGGRDINEATPDILKLLEDNGSLIAKSDLSHSYPHCWRCKKPVIYRTTPQWFISMEHNDLRKKALSAITNDVRWTPEWGSNRIYSMVENRPDWCISRQRLWGVPIALFTCKKCGKVITDDAVQTKIIASFKEHGADAWYENDISYYLGNDAKCPTCGGDIQKEMDILDVWFDSGTSHAAVCEVREELGGTADMYLEGTDQHRGWFHSSLLESIATRGKAPYKEVLTHGFVVDDDLQKMSKSLGNAVTPDEILKTYGAEILRLWVAAEDYTNDIRISPLILTRLVESYRKIRNTCRFLLGNLYDFEPADALEFQELKQLDRYILLKWQDCLERLYNGFENYQFHIFFHSIMNFCTNDLSSFYLDIIKDRLYSSIPDSGGRRSAQTAIFILAKELAAVIAPILSFTADEVWEFLPAWDGKPESVFTEYFPKLGRFTDDALRLRFDRLLSIRKVANRALEKARADKIIGHSLDAALIIGVKDGRDELSSLDEELSRLLIVSEAEIRDYDEGAAEKDDDISVSALPSDAPKCERCWSRSKQTDENGLCPRCAEVLKALG